MKKILPYLCLILLLWGCRTPEVNIATIQNTSTGLVGGRTATVYATIQYSQGAYYGSQPSITEYGVYLSTTNTEPSSRDDIYKVENHKYDLTEVAITLTNLQPSTTYYVRVFARNQLSAIEGDAVSFTTTGTVNVQTNNASSITGSSARLEGRITVVGENVNLRKRGFVLSTSSNPSLESNVAEWNEAGRTGSYSLSISGLHSSTRYYFRAYAQVDDDIIYGDVRNFTTSAGGNYSLADFLGTYSCQAWNVNQSKWEYWSGVTISSTSLPWNNGIIVEGLTKGAGYNYMHALGEYDAAKNCIRLYSSWARTSLTFYFLNDPSTIYYARFFAIYANGTSVYYINSGNGYNGAGEAWLSFSSTNTLRLGAAEIADENGRFANGMQLNYYLSSDNSYQGYFDAYTDVVLTKTSTGAPDHRAEQTQPTCDVTHMPELHSYEPTRSPAPIRP